MYGGRSGDILQDLSSLDPKTGIWKNINNATGLRAEFGRFGHTAIVY